MHNNQTISKYSENVKVFFTEADSPLQSVGRRFLRKCILVGQGILDYPTELLFQSEGLRCSARVTLCKKRICYENKPVSLPICTVLVVTCLFESFSDMTDCYHV